MPPVSLESNASLHTTMMQRCLMLAEQGRGWVHPNPMVGCVIVSAHGEIIGDGYHQQWGQAHAEVNALTQVAEKGLTAQLADATLYVSLEPCNHIGQTPPCTQAIIQSGIKRVVCGMVDPNPKVAGQGIQALRDVGIEVLVGVEEAACQQLNEAFYHAIVHQTPYVILKQAMTLDGRVATRTGDSQWITNAACRQQVHQLRAHSDAILSTAQSVIADNSQLTVREAPLGRVHPLRVILDRQGLLTRQSELALLQPDPQTGQVKPLVIVTAPGVIPDVIQSAWAPQGIICWECPEVALPESGKRGLDLRVLMKKMGESRLTQLMVEAGGVLSGHLMAQHMVHQWQLYIGNQVIGDPEAQPLISMGSCLSLSSAQQWTIARCETIDNNLKLTLYPNATAESLA